MTNSPSDQERRITLLNSALTAQRMTDPVHLDAAANTKEILETAAQFEKFILGQLTAEDAGK